MRLGLFSSRMSLSKLSKHRVVLASLDEPTGPSDPVGAADCTVTVTPPVTANTGANQPVPRAVTDVTPVGGRVPSAHDRPDKEGEKGPVAQEAPAAKLAKPTLGYLENVIRQYLYLPEQLYTLLPVWIAHTWVYEAFPCTPYLLIQSPTEGCGKSTLIDLIKAYCWQPEVSSDGSAAALVRIVSNLKPTLIVDEWDALKPEARELYFSILNGGFKEGAVYIRCEGDKNEPRKFPIYCPKCVAGVFGSKIPNTTLSRCIPFFLQPRPPGVRLKRLRRFDDEPERAKWLAWAKDNIVAMSTYIPEGPAEVSDRQLDLWEPLWAVCDFLSEGDWSARIRNLSLTLDKAVERGESPGVKLLATIKAGLNKRWSGKGAVSSSISSEDLLPLSGLPNAKALARMLKPFNIKPASRRDGSKVFKGYLMSDFERAWTEHRVDMYLAELAQEEAEGPPALGDGLQRLQALQSVQLLQMK